MREWYITIDVDPGSSPARLEFFTCRRETEQEAWNHAREKAASYSPKARVVAVSLIRG